METNEIRQRLSNLKGQSLFAQAIRNGVDTDFDGTIEMIVEQYKDNQALVTEIVGADTIEMIHTFKGE